MCMFCAAVPVAAATGTALDNKQRKQFQAEGRQPGRVRPFLILMMIVVFLLLVGSVIVHTRYSRFWL
ncbi:MAG TPA: hypothetical protein VMC09_09235 [Anaerolineales bacterium]|nr:hypothetical protein [Anaerolineales bacterium]